MASWGHQWGGGLAAKEHKETSGDDRNVHNLCGDGCITDTCPKIYGTIHLKVVHLVVCKIYLDKIDF